MTSITNDIDVIFSMQYQLWRRAQRGVRERVLPGIFHVAKLQRMPPFRAVVIIIRDLRQPGWPMRMGPVGSAAAREPGDAVGHGH